MFKKLLFKNKDKIIDKLMKDLEFEKYKSTYWKILATSGIKSNIIASAEDMDYILNK